MRPIKFQPPRAIDRRRFCAGATGCASLLLMRPIAGLPLSATPATAARPDVASIDHDRILAAAAHWLTQPPLTIAAFPCPRNPGSANDYYSEIEPTEDEAATPAVTKSGSVSTNAQPAFTAHRDALFNFGLAVPALAAAYTLTGEVRYAAQAVRWLHAWMINPTTRMSPAMEHAQTPHAGAGGRMEGIIEALPVVEVAIALPFLAASPQFTEADSKAAHTWFATYLDWLIRPQDSGPRLPALARDSRDHHGTSWLLQASAFAVLAAEPSDAARAEDATLAGLRQHYKHVLLRAQLHADGTFPHELASANPYRNSLFNLDIMAGACHLLSTRFDSVWTYSLEDGPGMRSAIAYHFPFIADRSTWPYEADSQHFKELPCRRASLLLAARAYDRPEYATTWKTLPPDAILPQIQRTMPIHQPLLWVTQPPRSL